MSILRRIARHMRLERKASDRALHHKLDGALNDAGLPIRSAVDGCRMKAVHTATASRKDVVTASLKLVL